METFYGKVVQVRNAPITVQNVVTYDTVIGVSNPDLKLKPGMTANVSIVIAHKDNVLQIKNAALRYRPPDATPVETRTGASQAGRPVGGRSGVRASAQRSLCLCHSASLGPGRLRQALATVSRLKSLTA
jgi:HlyD family secretion protein